MSDKVKRVVNNKMRGCYGRTTFEDNKPTKIEVSKKAHKDIKKDKSLPKKSRSLIDTIVHEEMHANHPNRHEKTIRKMAPKLVEKLGKLRKQALYNKYS